MENVLVHFLFVEIAMRPNLCFFKLALEVRDEVADRFAMTLQDVCHVWIDLAFLDAMHERQ
jgi:hypothetical protein